MQEADLAQKDLIGETERRVLQKFDDLHYKVETMQEAIKKIGEDGSSLQNSAGMQQVVAPPIQVVAAPEPVSATQKSEPASPTPEASAGEKPEKKKKKSGVSTEQLNAIYETIN